MKAMATSESWCDSKVAEPEEGLFCFVHSVLFLFIMIAQMRQCTNVVLKMTAVICKNSGIELYCTNSRHTLETSAILQDAEDHNQQIFIDHDRAHTLLYTTYNAMRGNAISSPQRARSISEANTMAFRCQVDARSLLEQSVLLQYLLQAGRVQRS